MWLAFTEFSPHCGGLRDRCKPVRRRKLASSRAPVCLCKVHSITLATQIRAGLSGISRAFPGTSSCWGGCFAFALWQQITQAQWSVNISRLLCLWQAALQLWVKVFHHTVSIWYAGFFFTWAGLADKAKISGCQLIPFALIVAVPAETGFRSPLMRHPTSDYLDSACEPAAQTAEGQPCPIACGRGFSLR